MSLTRQRHLSFRSYLKDWATEDWTTEDWPQKIGPQKTLKIPKRTDNTIVKRNRRQKDKQLCTKTTQKTKYRLTETSPKAGNKVRCFERVISSCYTCGTRQGRHVILVSNTVISHVTLYSCNVRQLKIKIKIQLSVLVYYKADLIIISLKTKLFAPWYSWKIAELASNNTRSL